MKAARVSTIVLAMLPAVAHAATRVSSDSACPAADAISQRLLGLVATGGPATAAARVRHDGDNLLIELTTPGEPSQERSLPAQGDCDAQAELAALVIAAWLDVMPVGHVATPGVPPRTQPPVARGGEADTDEVDEPAVSISTRTLLGAGLFGSADGLGANAGVALMGGMPRLLEAIGWTLEASLALPRQMSLGQGTVRYFRPTFALAASAELGGPRWMVRPQAGLALGVLSARGSGFAISNDSATTVTWGGVGGATLARASRRGEIWLRLDGFAWPQGRAFRSRAVPTGAVSEATLPAWEVRLSAGVSIGIH